MARNAAWLDMQDQLIYERAASREAGAPDFIADERGNIAIGQHTSHAASSLVMPVHDVYEEDRRSGGGARRVAPGITFTPIDTALVALDEVEVWVFTPEGIPVMDVELTMAAREQLDAPRPTWLERIARRFPAAARDVSGHVCDALLPRGECESCWLDSK